MTNVKPKFEIEKLTGMRTRKIAKPKTDQAGKLLGGFEYEDTEVDAGWMVYFPSGASIHVWTKEEMERQEFLRPPTLIDMETGDDVGTIPNTSLKAEAERIASRPRTTKAAQI